ncbi:hypothetical protein [Streptomyces cyslabdanicus]|uniref:hypothetical protein n=1 Tax=Streptomyces cyslabdanicus TaxID=1470456 RepID=UPI0040448BA5
MTGPEHYREAERLLSAASYTHGPGGDPVHPEAAAHHLAMAQVHATLAQVAALVSSQPLEVHSKDSSGFGEEDWDEWQESFHSTTKPSTTTKEN